MLRHELLKIMEGGPGDIWRGNHISWQVFSRLAQQALDFTFWTMPALKSLLEVVQIS